MDSERGICGKLPVEIIERVLSFLPVPVLCRMRSVCKTWKELIGRPSFHDLCDLNGKNNVYLFMWIRTIRGIEHSFVSTMSFLDLDTRRWYSIETIKLPRVCACGNAVETRFMAMDDGLVCELTSLRGTDNNFAFTLSDPVAKTRRMLPGPPEFYATRGAKPHLVTVVDNATRSYKVVLLNNLCETPRVVSLPRVYIHESFTNEWRGQRNLPNGVEGLWASSAVVLHQTVFVSNHSNHDFEFDQVGILSYKPQEGTWAEVWRMRFTRDVENQELVVSNNRLYMILWLEHPSCRIIPLPSELHCPNSESLFQTNQNYPETLFEVYEVLIAENGRKPVLQLTQAQLQQIFGSPDPDIYIYAARGFPCVDFNGVCNSIVLVSMYTGQIRRYYISTGVVDVLPPYPWVQTSEDADDFQVYDAKTMKLSLRNLLAQRPNTVDSWGWRLLQ